MGRRSRCRHISLSLALLLGSGFVEPLAAQLQEAGALQGRIRDSEGLPIPGALVRLFPGEAVEAVRGAESDALGYYHLEPLQPGRYRVEVDRLGFERAIREVTILTGRLVNADFSLTTDVLAMEGISVEAERSRDQDAP